jgi:hypothetical protein
MADKDFLMQQASLLKAAQRGGGGTLLTSKMTSPMNVQQELFLEDDLLNLKRDINVNIAHAGLDIIRSRDPLYKQEMKRFEEQKLE